MILCPAPIINIIIIILLFFYNNSSKELALLAANSPARYYSILNFQLLFLFPELQKNMMFYALNNGVLSTNYLKWVHRVMPIQMYPKYRYAQRTNRQAAYQQKRTSSSVQCLSGCKKWHQLLAVHDALIFNALCCMDELTVVSRRKHKDKNSWTRISLRKNELTENTGDKPYAEQHLSLFGILFSCNVHNGNNNLWLFLHRKALVTRLSYTALMLII